MSQVKGDRSINGSTPPPIDVVRWKRGDGDAQQVWAKGSWAFVTQRLQQWKIEFDAITISRDRGEGTFFKIEAAQGGDDVTEIFEITGSNLTQSVLLSLVMRKKFIDVGILPANYVKTVSDIVREVNKFKGDGQSYADMRTNVSGIMSLATSPDIGFELQEYLCKAGDAFLNGQYAFHHTTSVSERIFNLNNGSFANAYDNAFRIHSAAQVYNFEGVPPEFVLPPQILDNSQPAEWLKLMPNCNLTTGGKRSLVNQYLFADEWSRLVYATAI